jgi:hypothetical protein
LPFSLSSFEGMAGKEGGKLPSEMVVDGEKEDE